MYVNAVKASYAEQFENISHLGPSSVSNLIEIADVAAEKSNMLFSRTWDILSKLLKPHLVLLTRKCLLTILSCLRSYCVCLY